MAWKWPSGLGMIDPRGGGRCGSRTELGMTGSCGVARYTTRPGIESKPSANRRRPTCPSYRREPPRCVLEQRRLGALGARLLVVARRAVPRRRYKNTRAAARFTEEKREDRRDAARAPGPTRASRRLPQKCFWGMLASNARRVRARRGPAPPPSSGRGLRGPTGGRRLGFCEADLDFDARAAHRGRPPPRESNVHAVAATPAR